MEIVREESFGIIPLRHVGDEWNIFIILHKHGNHWGFPKGKAIEGEDSKTSAFRELQEETGLKVQQLLKKEPIIEEYKFIRRGTEIHKRVTYFPAIVSGALLLQPEEIRDGKWLTLNEAQERLTFPEAKRVCKDLKKDLKK